ncbi:MAG TPA: hypothetical protein VFE14_16895 [Micromonosporaceae bacterium]|jgi:hypothetical protein|nr:hypothetical protein [Micromonosporaceae bacterium]
MTATIATAAACNAAGPPTPPRGPDTGTPGTGVPTAWPLPADASAAAAKAGLQMLGEEKLTVHYHAHLDVIVRGNRIQVPAFIGIDRAKQKITALHTHDTSGIVHIESADDVPFTLGQVFTEWGQPLSTTQLGPVTAAAGEVVRVYRNGNQTSDMGALRLAAHDEIVVWLGPSGSMPNVPKAYDFPAGL